MSWNVLQGLMHDQFMVASFSRHKDRGIGGRHRRLIRWFGLFLVTLLLFSAAGAGASTYVGLDHEDDVYFLLSRLEAEGIVNSGLLATRPISRNAALRLLLEAEQNADGRSGFIKGLILELRHRLRPEPPGADGPKIRGSAYARYVYTDAAVRTLSYRGADHELMQALNENNDGDLYEPGSNYRFGLTARIEKAGPFSLYLNPELGVDDEHEQGVLRTGYGVIGFSWIDIVIGRDAQWWGPGHHGALLLSNNAEPLTMIRFTGPVPQTLPWILKYLGPFQYNVFVSQLEKDRSDYSRPYFWGMRFDFKPHRYIEIGLERTALLGGRGRPTDAQTWLRSVLGSSEHDASGNPGDQRAGADVKITLPFAWQPMQLYWERAGEENRQDDMRLPYKMANLYGLYLPSLFGFERIDLRAEYAETEVNEQAYVWYTHGTYTAGYTYRGMVMGHHMGTESNDLYLELSCLIPEHSARISLSFDWEKHNLEGPVGESVSELMLNGSSFLSEHLEISASFGYGRIENPGNAVGPTRKATEMAAMVRYIF